MAFSRAARTAVRVFLWNALGATAGLALGTRLIGSSGALTFFGVVLLWIGGGIGVVQLLWILPLWLRAHGRTDVVLASGILWGAALTVLMNGLCWGALFSIGGPG